MIGGLLGLAVVITGVVVVVVFMVFTKRCQSEKRVDNGSAGGGPQGYNNAMYCGM